MPRTPNLFNETFEDIGYVAMTGSETIGAGSVLDEDYPTSMAGWGSQCLRAVSATPNTQCQKIHTFGVALTGPQLYFRDEIYIVSEAMADGTSKLLFQCWADTGFTIPLFTFWLRRDLPNFKLTCGVENGGSALQHNYFGVVTRVRYVIELAYNLTTHDYEYRVNGVTVATGTATLATGTACALLLVGSDLFDTASGNPSEILHDNIGIGNQGWLGSTDRMPYVAADRVKETSTTTGTGDLTLAGAVSGFRAFSQVARDGYRIAYSVGGGSQWETGVGTWLYPNILQRTKVLASSNAGALVNFSAGTKEVGNHLIGSALRPVSRIVSSDIYLPPRSRLYVPDDYEVLSGTDVEVGPEATVEVG